MRQAIHQLSVPPRSRGLHEITREVARWVADQRIATGLLTVFCRHTSASLLIQENADPDVRTDLERLPRAASPRNRAAPDRRVARPNARAGRTTLACRSRDGLP